MTHDPSPYEPPILPGKIALPAHRAHFVSRPRLLRRLYELLDYKLIQVIAPAGYGKTSLVAELANQVELPVCWFTADPGDRDLGLFFRYIAATLLQTFPQLRRSAPGDAQGLVRFGLSPHQLAALLAHELHHHVHEHFLLVIDDAHFIDDHPGIGAFLSRFVLVSGEQVQIALLSRRLLRLPDLVLLVARGLTAGLGTEDLRFQPEEIREVLRRSHGLHLTLEEAESLAERTDGWITGLLLSSRPLGESHAPLLSGPQHPNALAVYLREQVLDLQPEPMQRFLLDSSVLDFLSPEICAHVLGPLYPEDTDWQALLSEVRQRHLFVVETVHQEVDFRYSHLFQEFLQDTLRHSDPERWETLLRRRMAYHQERGQWNEVFRCLRLLEDTEAMARLIAQLGTWLVAEHRFGLLGEWLSHLPAERVGQDPILLSLRGVLEAQEGRPEIALALMDEAVHRLEREGSPEQLARGLVRRAMLHHYQGRHTEAIHDAQRALEHLHQEDAGTFQADTDAQEHLTALREQTRVVAEAQRLLGLSHHFLGRLDQAAEHLQRSLRNYTAAEDRTNQARVEKDLGSTWLAAGRYRNAQAIFEQALVHASELGNLMLQSTVHNDLGVLHSLLGDYSVAVQHLLRALQLARSIQDGRMEAYVLASLADVCCDVGLESWAVAYYLRARQQAEQVEDRHLVLYTHLALARLQRSDPTSRERYLEAARQLLARHPSAFEYGLYYLVVGSHYLLDARTEEALPALAQATAMLAQTDNAVEEARARFLLAVTRHQLGQEPEAMEEARQAVSLAARLESWHALMPTVTQVSRHLQALGHRSGASHYLRRFLRDAELWTRQRPVLQQEVRRLLDEWTETPFRMSPPLVLRAFGRGLVLLDDRPVEPSAWQSAVARELLFCLLEHPQGLTREQIGGLFWPDASPEEVHIRVKNALYRLRHALFPEVVTYEEGIYRFNRDLEYLYDVEEFLHHLEQARKATEPDAIRGAYEEALRHYTGDYLEEGQAPWIHARREELRQLYIDASLELAELYLAQGRYSEALIRSHSLLQMDPCLESAHRLAMRVHAARGNRAQIIRQYETCRATLRQELDVAPSPQTDQLLIELLGNVPAQNGS